MQAWTGINWQRCRALHAIFACLVSGIWWILLSLGQILLGMWYKKLINKGMCLTHINYDLISLSTIFHLSKSWTRMRDFSVFFTLCSYILPFIFSIPILIFFLLKIKCFVLTKCNQTLWQQPVFFSQTGVIVTHNWYKSALLLSIQWCWISFKTVAHGRELELHSFQQMTYR